MSKKINIIFPHQLFHDSPLLENDGDNYLIEEYLFFSQYKFHKQKIAFHRASMMHYKEQVEKMGHTVHYIDAQDKLSDIREFVKDAKKKKVTEVHYIDPTDDWLHQRIEVFSEFSDLICYENPLFINSEEDLTKFFRPDKKSFFQTTFYKQQRIKYKILIDVNQKPVGGKWTYDKENRKKYPKKKTPPEVKFPRSNKDWKDAVAYTQKNFGDYPGELNESRLYPTTRKESLDWLNKFFEDRFHEFGVYEDAIVSDESILNHSVLTPMMNVGLIGPKEIINQALTFAKKNDVPINSLEGFVRQIIGWREFIRGMYYCKGRFSRSTNFWNFTRKIPSSFYDGTTGIVPIDITIKKVLKTGYCHHIERLMVLGNFILLCEFDPDEVYRWFMELFIDAYDWVMVPNVYGMSLFADGGTFATKPYISGSNYLKKMGDYPKGDWQEIWDGLFWRFMFTNEEFFSSNPRLSMLVHSMNRMSDEKREKHLENAEKFIAEVLDAKV